MATMYRLKSGVETPGESLVYDKFKSMLPSEYLVWHNQVPPQGDREIDFVILHPTFGVWVVEVKDWVIDQLSEVDTDSVTLKKAGALGLSKTSRQRNPLRQARDNLIALKEVLQKQRVLTHGEGAHQGKLLVPLNNFAILTNISGDEVAKAGLDEMFVAGRVWTKDFIADPYETGEGWEAKLLESREYKFQCHLDLHQINAIKRGIGVAVVIDPKPKADEAASAGSELDFGTLDEHQSQLVHQEILQQITIEGPAGSGKSIVLLKRAIYIHREYPHWRIGIVCFNTLMANYLRTILAAEEDGALLAQSIEIFDIYQWMSRIGLPGVTIPNQPTYDEGLRSALDRADWKVAAQYDALLVDEGQDSTDTLLKLYRCMLLDREGSFTFFFDRRQALYQGSVVSRLTEYGFSIDAEKNLVKQQRSALVLLALAYFEAVKGGADSKPEIIVGEVMRAAEKMFVGWRSRVGAVVSGTMRFFKSVWEKVSRKVDGSTDAQGSVIDLGRELDEVFSMTKVADGELIVKQIVEKVKLLKSKGDLSYGDISVLLPSKYYGPGMVGAKVMQRLQAEFRSGEIPYIHIDREGAAFDGKSIVQSGDNRRDAPLSSDAVKVMTIHASKGYDSAIVFIAGFDDIHANSMAEVGYVALTRAKKRCEVYYCSESASIQHLTSVLGVLRQQRINAAD